MKIIETTLPGVLLFEPEVFGDERGFFVETFRECWMREAGVEAAFVQDNHSRSGRGVLRGLHFQTYKPQGKLVRVGRGRVFDVAVDVRCESPNFGKWVGVELNDVNHRILWVPPGYAHGFCVLSEWADFIYKCTTYYDPGSDAGIYWKDRDISIVWPEKLDEGSMKISSKDNALPILSDLKRINFTY